MSNSTGEAGPPTNLLAGVAEIDITPDRPVELAGFAARSGVSEGVDHPLFLRAFWFTSSAGDRPDQSALVVIGDFIRWPSGQSDELRRQISTRWPVPPEHIVLSATHTHSGPQTSYDPTAVMDERWVRFLIEQLFDVIDAAWHNRQPASIARGRGITNIGMNRRWLRGEENATAENPEGRIDREVIVLRMATPDDRPIAVLVHHACHPSIANGRRLSSEFPGVMSGLVAERLGEGAIVGFLQGCAGEINASITRDRPQRALGRSDVETVGAELAGDVLRILDGPLERIAVDQIRATVATADLPTEHVPTLEELAGMVREPGIRGTWARWMRDEPGRLVRGVPMDLIHLRLGDDLAFLTMPGEVTTPYGLVVKRQSNGNTLPLAYSNGLIGYVVTAAQLAEGGYEALESTLYYGQPSPWSPLVESTLMRVIERLLQPGADPANNPTAKRC
jgi:hypothetical protein